MQKKLSDAGQNLIGKWSGGGQKQSSGSKNGWMQVVNTVAWRQIAAFRIAALSARAYNTIQTLYCVVYGL